ncbi:phosphopantetheine-binding protein [Mycoplasmopsis glycophila]|uniref:Acyl carrier protein n=1 Tax=Mycoplasmopsis glycophila TaxID=171285 RepID=A0A449AVI0_9BACT|nr:phosphopantetheine-binding protein [Mycoplasmopsis glycophila]VEU70599.1 acyl carrier protein [Mycoplasmopsis glycophila]
MNIKETILDALKRVSKKQVKEDDHIVDLGIDSLDLAMLVVHLEEKFSIQISDEEIMNIKTVKDIILLVENQK